MTFLSHIADQVLNRPLMITPEKLAVIIQVLDGRLGIDASRIELGPRAGEGFDAFDDQAGASRFVGSNVETGDDGRRNGVLPYKRTADGVAILTITGTLVNRGAWVGASSGLTSYEGIKHQIDQIAADPKVKWVVLDIDSPGGAASGSFETATAVRALDAKKPVIAVVNGMACSAAYAIASGARRIVSTPTGVSGSIGVVLMHVDYSGAMDKAGVKATFIHAGAHKVDGNPYEPLSKGVRGDLQAEVDAFYDLFVETVARGRKGLSATKIRGTEARAFIGADAKARGLVDDIATFDDVIASKDVSGPYFPGAALGRVSSGAVDLALSPHSQAVAHALIAASATLAGTPGAGAVDLTLSANSLAIAHATALANAAAAAPGVSLADRSARPVAANNFALTPKQGAGVPWEQIVDQVNAGAAARKFHERLPVPRQAGAVSWSDIVDQVNTENGFKSPGRAEVAGRESPERLPAPRQPGAASWSDVVDKINAEKASSRLAIANFAGSPLGPGANEEARPSSNAASRLTEGRV